MTPPRPLPTSLPQALKVERRRDQNRRAQRAYRLRLKERLREANVILEGTDSNVAHTYQDVEPGRDTTVSKTTRPATSSSKERIAQSVIESYHSPHETGKVVAELSDTTTESTLSRPHHSPTVITELQDIEANTTYLNQSTLVVNSPLSQLNTAATSISDFDLCSEKRLGHDSNTENANKIRHEPDHELASPSSNTQVTCLSSSPIIVLSGIHTIPSSIPTSPQAVGHNGRSTGLEPSLPTDGMLGSHGSGVSGWEPSLSSCFSMPALSFPFCYCHFCPSRTYCSPMSMHLHPYTPLMPAPYLDLSVPIFGNGMESNWDLGTSDSGQ